MGMLRRGLIYLAVNIAVVVAISVLLNLLGVRPYLAANGIHYGGLLIFCALFGFVGSFVSLQISRWAAKRAYGIHLVDPAAPQDELEAFLAGKVQALCTAAGLTTLPEIGIYDSAEVNAFATGPSADRALVAVSVGLLENMDEQAIEGILGHEISHIANGDMVTMALVQGVVNTFVMFFARVLAMIIDNFISGDDDGGGLGFFGYIMVVIVLESVLMLLASPIVFAFSRWREYRADAGSAGIAGAETMIHALVSLNDCEKLIDKRAPALATMKIHGGARGIWGMLYRSHPRIEDRIKALQQRA